MPASIVTFHDAAAADYDAAFEWYLERNPDAAVRFDAEVERATAEIARALSVGCADRPALADSYFAVSRIF